MSFLGEEIKVGDVEQDTGFDPIPDGWYTVSIAQADLTDTKAGTGKYIKMRLDVTGPSHQGRVIFCNLNIRNPNPKAEEIGRKQLDSVMRSIGLSGVQDTDQLIGGVMAVKVTTKHDEQYGDSNEVKGFKSVNGSSAPTPSTMPKPSSTPQAPAAVSPPWAKK